MDVKETIATVLSKLDLEELIKTVSHNPPWWVYVVLALIPLSITIVVREMYCWFTKSNRILRRVRSIEISLAEIEERLGELQPAKKPLFDPDEN